MKNKCGKKGCEIYQVELPYGNIDSWFRISLFPYLRRGHTDVEGDGVALVPQTYNQVNITTYPSGIRKVS